MTTLTTTDTLSAQRADGLPLVDQIARIEARIRSQPTTASHRWALFQLLCIVGEWSRAIQQLQVWAKLEPGQARTAQMYRDLIRAERWRAKVVEGRERPGVVLASPPWIDALLDAIRHAADGQVEQADTLRDAAFQAASDIPLVAPSQGHAAWIADSDARFGPVCEVITAGHYRWVPFADLAEWRVLQPAQPIDLVWAPCTLTLIDGSLIHGFMPARYPGSETGSDAVRLGRETFWRDIGRTGVVALGQKTWATDLGDFSLFELAHAEFGSRATRAAIDADQAHD
ncbi:type VI secretion system accessory protein TagJ [Burkholderia sp. Ac-20349]|uniref:type VI secretion system accessory protein TagJ n=1 Tax=Burkholderia sp. Ac-20349 TaxID=2703893 RepID=UPI0004D69D23|nr:type VI secretion system accessory protein TagJ [Burkholderia sp. Ac-20349]KER72459.1 ImpE/SciE family protein [Burkholderia cepacia]MBN3839520.1 ImpE/SciE family protein [Burkholderia sp. Ac-20349]